jgi:pyrroloquinoline quinone biosynthesis protein D
MSAMTPVISHGFRLQWEPAQSAHVLLYPEGMIKLNVSAAEILRRCDGSHTVDQIVNELEQVFQATGLTPEVMQFIDSATHRGWLRMS